MCIESRKCNVIMLAMTKIILSKLHNFLVEPSHVVKFWQFAILKVTLANTLSHVL